MEEFEQHEKRGRVARLIVNPRFYETAAKYVFWIGVVFGVGGGTLSLASYVLRLFNTFDEVAGSPAWYLYTTVNLSSSFYMAVLCLSCMAICAIAATVLRMREERRDD